MVGVGGGREGSSIVIPCPDQINVSCSGVFDANLTLESCLPLLVLVKLGRRGSKLDSFGDTVFVVVTGVYDALMAEVVVRN